MPTCSLSDLKKLTILCIAVGFVILIVIAGIVIVWKWRESSQQKPPSTVLLQEEQYRLNKGPLPPVPENSSHYRSLIRQADPQAFPQHSQTMPRPPPQQDMQEGDDYSTDWRFGTAPWQKQGVQANVWRGFWLEQTTNCVKNSCLVHNLNLVVMP